MLYKRHFGKAFMFDVELTNNLSKNRLVQNIKLLDSEEEIKNSGACNATKKQLPVILPNDIMARYNLVVRAI